MNVVIREGRGSDMPYVVGTWADKLAKHGNVPTRYTKVWCYATLQKARLTVACLPDDQDAIIGFLVSEGPQCHMLYVRSSARRLGVANAICRKVWA